MASLNEVTLMGNLTRDPKMSYLPSGTTVCEFALALNRKWKDKEEVCYVDLVAFEKRAELVNEHYRKGDPMLVLGRLKMDTWDDKKTGAKRSRLKVVVEELVFLPRSRTGGGGEGPPPPSSRPPDPGQDSDSPTVPGEEVGGGDNIPF